MQDDLKQAVAKAAIAYIGDDEVIGVGTGSTVNFFIDELARVKHRIEGAVASSVATAERLKSLSIPIVDLNHYDQIAIYIDGADECNHHLQLIKGGGGAFAREKIVAEVAKKFICIADESKYVLGLGQFPLPVEVFPMARSLVARRLVKLGGDPVYRQGFVTDNGNVILDVHNLNMPEPLALEKAINNIVGVVSVGLFAARPADVLLLGRTTGVETILAR